MLTVALSPGFRRTQQHYKPRDASKLQANSGRIILYSFYGLGGASQCFGVFGEFGRSRMRMWVVFRTRIRRFGKI
jgi:hypothetical protein